MVSPVFYKLSSKEENIKMLPVSEHRECGLITQQDGPMQCLKGQLDNRLVLLMGPTQAVTRKSLQNLMFKLFTVMKEHKENFPVGLSRSHHD